MNIRVVCDKCQSGYRVSDALAGKAARCRKCGNLISIPGNAAAPANGDDTGHSRPVEDPAHRRPPQEEKLPEIRPSDPYAVSKRNVIHRRRGFFAGFFEGRRRRLIIDLIDRLDAFRRIVGDDVLESVLAENWSDLSRSDRFLRIYKGIRSFKRRSNEFAQVVVQTFSRGEEDLFRTGVIATGFLVPISSEERKRNPALIALLALADDVRLDAARRDYVRSTVVKLEVVCYRRKLELPEGDEVLAITDADFLRVLSVKTLIANLMHDDLSDWYTAAKALGLPGKVAALQRIVETRVRSRSGAARRE